MKIIAMAFHWLGRQFLSLLMIMLILVVGSYLYSGIQKYVEDSRQISALELGQSQILTTQAELEAKAKKRIQEVNKGSRQELDQQIGSLDREIATLESKRRSEYDRKIAFIKGDFHQDIKLELHIDILKQGRKHLEDAKAMLNTADAIAKGRPELERRRQLLDYHYKQWQFINGQIATLNASSPYAVEIPFTYEYKQLKLLEADLASAFEQNQNANIAYWSQKRFLDQLGTKILEPFQPVRVAYNEADSNIRGKILGKKTNLAENWISQYVNPALDTLPTALLILFGTILTPIAIKGAFFYVIAPIASRRPPICLEPQSSGIIIGSREMGNGEGKISSVSLLVTLGKNEELLVHPEYIRSMSESSCKSTKWLLDNKYPLTSIASGLCLLTRLRSDSDHSHIVSAAEDPLAELAVIELPAGSKLVLQPQHVIGVIQPKNQPLTIESKWRISSLTAWLTLQLRYLVFSGPAKILVKGCRGVRVDPAGKGQTINQSATMGFSANLAYAVNRGDPFIAYARGKQELFDDKFTGGSGYYVSEEMPNLGKKSGFTGKGLEGLADSALKVFGV
jgi:hypothetical protein